MTINTLLSESTILLKIGKKTYPYTAAGTQSAYLVLDKVTSGNDSAVVFRDAGAIKGEIGAASDDDIHLKVATGSAGSETFVDAIILKNSTGYVYVPLQMGVGTVPAAPLHVAGSSSGGRIAAKIENTNTTASTSSGTQLELKGNASAVDWLVGTDFSENSNNNFFVQDSNNGLRFFIDSSGRVVLGSSASATTTTNSSIETPGSIKTTGANYSLGAVNFVGHQSTSGAPASGTFATGDLIFDSLGYPYYCTSGGTPGTWIGGANKVNIGTGTPGTVTGQKTGDVFIDMNTGNVYTYS